MRAFILAGGLGTRLRPIVDDQHKPQPWSKPRPWPKALAPIGSVPFLEHQIDFLRRHGIEEFVLCVGYLHEQIQTHFRDGRNWDVQIRYSVEEALLGTAGALKNAGQYVDDTFLLLNGDTFFDLDLERLRDAHQRHTAGSSRCTATLALTGIDDASSYGSVTTDRGGRILEFHEKDRSAEPPHYISAGIYVMQPHILDLIPPSRSVSLENETFPAVLESGRELYGHCTDGFFVDIGTPEGFHRFREHLGASQS